MGVSTSSSFSPVSTMDGQALRGDGQALRGNGLMS